MKKTMIATAVAAAFALPMAAQADVTVYGKVHTAIVNVDATGNGTNANTATTENWQVKDGTSRLGFKGSEDLGGGMQAIWKYEQAYDTDESGAVTSGRNTYVGLAGSFGTFLVGRHDTPYKMSWYAGGADFADDTIADMNGSGFGGDNVRQTSAADSDNKDAGVHFDEDRMDNVIAYVSPDMSGFQAALAIMPGESNVENGLADSWSAGLMYGASGLKVGAGMESLANADAATNNTPQEKRMHLTGSYTFDGISVGASIARVKNDNYVDNDKKTSMALSAQYAFDNNAVGANYRHSSLKDDNGNDGKIDSWSLYLMHSMSKRTQVYAAYGANQYEEDNNSAADQETNEYGVGIIHSF